MERNLSRNVGRELNVTRDSPQEFGLTSTLVHEPNHDTEPISQSESEQKVPSDSSSKSWHSAQGTASEVPVNDPFLKQLQSIFREEQVAVEDPFLKQLQTILKEEQDSNRSIFSKVRSSDSQTRARKLQHAKPARSEEIVELEKRLDESYQRIADLEARVNDLTHLQSLELPESLDEVLSQEKQKTEYMKLKELKKKAERQFTEARQTTQRMVAENCKLKEELLQEKHANEMKSQQIKALTRENHAQKHFDDKIKMWKSLRSVELKQATDPKLTLRVDYPDIEVTPQMLWEVIYDDSATLTTGHVVIVGLPYSYKTTLVKRMLSTDGSTPSFSGDQRHLQMFEAVVHENPLTKEKVWQSVDGIDCAVMYIASALVRRCYELKRSPVFPKELPPARVGDSVKPKIKDLEIEQHFREIYLAVKDHVEKARKDGTFIDLALSRHIMVNIWDLGVNRALYDIFPSTASYSDSIVVIDVCDLERDAFNLSKPPDFSQKDDYSAWNDDQCVLQVESRLYYLTLMAGVKQWYSSDTQGTVASGDMVPQAVLIGVHTKEFRERNGGKDLETALKRLGRRVSDQSTKLGITDTIDTNVVAVCIDEEQGVAAEGEINKFRKAVEKIMLAQSNIETTFPVRNMFLRSLFYRYPSSHILKSKMAASARSCGILLEQSFHQLLECCRNVGSVMFFPELANSPASAHVILKVAEFVKQVSKLYYLQRHVEQDQVPLNARAKADFDDHYQYGIITECLAEAVFGKEATVLMDALFIGNLCSKIKLLQEPDSQSDSPRSRMSSPEPPPDFRDAFFFPSLRIQYNSLDAGSDKDALRIVPTMFLPLESLALFLRYLDSCFSDDNIPDVKHCKEYNMLCFQLKNPNVQVKIIYFSKVVEIRIEGATTDSCVHRCFKSLFLQVLHHVRSYCPKIKQTMFLRCPNSTDDSVHYVEFSHECHDTTCYCVTCKSNVQFTGPRRLWLL